METISRKYISSAGIVFAAASLFFILVVFLPAVYVLSYIFKEKFAISENIASALGISFLVAFVVTAVDLFLGTALAWAFVKSKSKYKTLIDNFIDLPLILPTSALGLSVFLFWGEFWNFKKGLVLIILLHIIFTIPYMIRSVSAAIEQINKNYEESASTLGACPFTLFRTVSIPLFKDGLVVGSVLTFTRSLSETGATMMVASAAAVTAPLLIVNFKSSGDIPQAAVSSVILIISALLILIIAKFLTGKKHFNFETAYVRLEKSLSGLGSYRNYLVAVFFLVIVIAPTFYIIFYNFLNFNPVFNAVILKSFFVSFGIAFFVTALGVLFAIPMSYFIARSKNRELSSLFENLHEIVLLVPTSALGVSLGLFWSKLNLGEFFILALSHLSFTFPLLVKPITAAIKNVDYGLEESAYVLGAKQWTVLTSILFPLIMPAIVAGSIMAFMRSLSETGATLAVTGNIKTVSVLIVDLVKNNQLSEAGFLCFVLFIIAFAFLIVLKKTKETKKM